jgi:hypothetical protein
MNRRSAITGTAFLALSAASLEGTAGVAGSAPVVRVSLGWYPPDKASEVAAIMDYQGKPLGEAIKKLSGLISFYSGIDREQHAVTNVSLWKDLASAEQMTGLQPMIEQGKALAAIGVKFVRPITNSESLWIA